jgi:hypothetical protein
VSNEARVRCAESFTKQTGFQNETSRIMRNIDDEESKDENCNEFCLNSGYEKISSAYSKEYLGYRTIK